MTQIISTTFLLPGYVVSNGATTGNAWTDPNNILLVDTDLTESNPGEGTASDIEIGGFNANLPQNAIITGIEMELIAKGGAQTSPPLTLTVYAVDNTSGQDVLYPYTAPFSGLTPTLATYTLGTPTYQFATAWTPNQINNLKFLLVANGDIYIDSFLLKVYYYIPGTPTPPAPVVGGCISCNSPIQVQRMFLQQPFLSNQSKFYLIPGSFQYPDGTPVQPGDLGACGGQIDMVIDQSKKKGTGGDNFEENVTLDISTGFWQVLPSGVIEVDIGSVNNRGLMFHEPYTHDATLMSDHDASAEVIITNNGVFYSRFVRVCQVDTVFSAPIIVLNQNVPLADPAHSLDFEGAGVTVVNDGTDPNKKIITIPGVGGTTPPNVGNTNSSTTGAVQATGLTFTVVVAGLDRIVKIEVCTEEAQTISSILVGGVAATQQAVATDVGNNLRSEIWVCVAPPLGTQNVVITLSGAAYITAGATCFSGVDQATPVGATQTATGNDNNPTLSITSTVDYSIISDGLVTAMTPILYTVGAGQTALWSIVANGNTRQGGASYEPAGTQPDVITMDYSITQSTPWAYTAIEILGITSPSPALDHKVLIDASDTTPDYLASKIVAGTGITLNVLNPGGNEQLEIVNSGGGGTGNGVSWFGTGSDGNVTISINTILSADMYYDTLTINVGVTLSTNGYKISAKTIINNGTIDNSGTNAGNGGNASGATGALGGTAGIGGLGNTFQAGPNGQAGGDGGTSGNGVNGSNGTNENPSLGVNGVAGGDGGSGNGFAGGTGGTAGTATTETVAVLLDAKSINLISGSEITEDFSSSPSGSISGFTLSPSAGSGSGAGGGGNTSPSDQGAGGGGSGGTAGVIAIICESITISATGKISSNGGNGGNGGDSGVGIVNGGAGGGGSGGSGGVIILVYSTLINAGTIETNGGTKGLAGTVFTGGTPTDGNDGLSGNIYKLKIL